MNNKRAFKLDLTAFKGVRPGMEETHETRYLEPPYAKELTDEQTVYANAEKLARELSIGPLRRAFVIVNGSFIFGDFIEALIVHHNWHVKALTISTLSFSENNVDSLHNLLVGGYVDQLTLVMSAMEYAHERFKLVPYLLQQCDIDNRFQFAAAGTHCKVCLIETHCGGQLVIHGSANLRSSGNLEQFIVEDSPVLYAFNKTMQDRIVAEFRVINHDAPNPQKLTPLRHQKLWQVAAPDSRK